LPASWACFVPLHRFSSPLCMRLKPFVWRSWYHTVGQGLVAYMIRHATDLGTIVTTRQRTAIYGLDISGQPHEMPPTRSYVYVLRHQMPKYPNVLKCYRDKHVVIC
jgi:hypothetical protein